MSSDLTDPDTFNPDDWITAAETLRLVRGEMGDGARQAIATRAHAGLLRSWAATLRFKNTNHSSRIIPAEFWWARGQAALEQNWALGEFSTWIEQKHEVEAFGVRFHRTDLAAMIPDAFKATAPTEPTAVALQAASGRPLSPLWPDWVAELAAYLHENGAPAGQGAAGQEALIAAVEAALASRRLEAPSRTTVQETVRRVLLRLREAGN